MKIMSVNNNTNNSQSQPAFKGNFNWTNALMKMIPAGKQDEFAKAFDAVGTKQIIEGIKIQGEDPLFKVKKGLLGGFKMQASCGEWRESSKIDYARQDKDVNHLISNMINAMREASRKIDSNINKAREYSKRLHMDNWI